MIAVEYFSSEYDIAIQANRSAARFELVFQCGRDYWDDAEVLGYFRQIDTELETSVLNAPVTITLIDGDLFSTFHHPLD